MSEHVGCSDHGCVFRVETPGPRGMGTNGGCRCIPQGRTLPDDRVRLRKAIRALADRCAKAEEQAARDPLCWTCDRRRRRQGGVAPVPLLLAPDALPSLPEAPPRGAAVSDTLPVQEAIDAARRVNSGELVVQLAAGGWPYCGNAVFRSECGWEFVVFSDCDEFDYFDSVTSPEGRRWSYEGAPDYESDRMDLVSGEIEDVYRSRWGVA